MTDCLDEALPGRWWRKKDPCLCGKPLEGAPYEVVEPHLLIEHELVAHGTLSAAARAHGTSPHNVSAAWSSMHSLPKLTPGFKAKTVEPAEPEDIEVDVDQIGDVAALLAERGMNVDDWIIIRVTVNRWEGFHKNKADEAVKVPLRQLKVTLRPRVRIDLLLPMDLKPLKLAAALPRRSRASRLIFVYGDDQRPNVDRGFEAAKLAWLKRNQPDAIVDLGDGMEFATISQHKPDPANDASVQECANDYASWLYTVRRACPAADMVVLADNHVHRRLRDYQLERARQLYGVRPADVPGLEEEMEPLLSLRRLLRLDEMNVTYIEPGVGSHYAESQYEIVPGQLVALHGYRTGGNVGRKLLDDYGCSVIYGHVHGQDVTVTDARRRGVGERSRLYALGVGCGARIHGGSGFAPGADWQNCALTISVFPGGGWSWSYMNYEHGVLRWRDQEYVA